MDSDQIVNFLNSKFDTKIKCSCAVEDFYSIENLISNDEQKCDRGFMAFRVVKPPVSLEFQLCCCIELVSIKIWPQIDSLKSTGFEIFVNSDRVPEYCKIGSHFNLQENCIQFINDSINNGQYNHENSSSRDEHFAVVSFFPSTKNKLRRVKNIKCVIKQTARCVPVIKRLEVWGKISKFATDQQKEKIHQIIRKEIEQVECVETEKTRINGDSSNLTINRELNEDSAIPEPFLDTITFEIMALPMVLPSGKIIDNSTLLKHIEQGEKWGRVPSDPFTGQPFTDSRKPVLNVHLKAQIDSFLLKNCSMQSVATLPRTIGSITKRRTEQSEYTLPPKKCHQNDTIETPLLPSLSSSSSSSSSSFSSSSSSSSTATASTFRSSTLEVKSQSMDEAIRGVLKIGKYTSNVPTENNLNIKKCFQCVELVSNNLYTITICSHLICRNCLVEKNISICKCGRGFSNIDVNKYHHKIIL
ncbi:RING finger protein 37 [Sitodiplosis mosellana]|uniref:RING finger protein 37 n=1 Tax=Sitodiplosis mosellana TaxID=263140 RepID=UPI002444C4C7|nr:RING finger protein 37 [Sitodiplosis mosellana]